jgi:predicted metal-dependent hydrolase
MSFKHFELKDVGKITVYKKRSNKSLKISVSQDNEIKISLPIWTPYAVGVEFARRNKEWIKNNLSVLEQSFQNNQIFGKNLQLQIVPIESSKIFRSRISHQKIMVYLPDGLDINSDEVQDKIKNVIKRALKKESNSIIKQRLDIIARQTRLEYKDLNIKELKRRWGSCDTNGRITINLYLIQLPWELIDYVLLHELVHTIHMSHDSNFWGMMNELSPDVKRLRSEIKKYKPVIYKQFD